MTGDRRCSVVVPCYNRAAHLDRLLGSLTWSAVSPREFEVVVVNDGGSDQVQSVAGSWRARGLDVTCLDLRPPGPPRNNAKARNAGWKAARYPLIIQTDPEIVFVTDVLHHYRCAIRPGRFCSCGAFHQLTRESSLVLDAAGAPEGVGAEAYLAQAAGRPNQVHSPDGVGALHGAFGVRRDDLAAAGGYDESFGEWGWEDRELLVTLRRDFGLERDLVAGVVLVHMWHPQQRGDDGRARAAAAGRVADAAWRVQFQRARAEWPRSQRRFRDVDLADSAPADGFFSPERYAQVITAADRLEFERASIAAASGLWRDAGTMLPAVHQQLFRAMESEATALCAAGQYELALVVGGDALRCPWERPESEPERTLVYDRNLSMNVSPTAWLYSAAPDLVGRLAVAAMELGEAERADRFLGAMATWQGDATGADAIRARRALQLGDLAAASVVGRRLSPESRTPGVLLILAETALAEGHWETAWAAIERIAKHSDANYFERLAASACCGALREGLVGQGSVDLSAAGLDDVASADTSEYLFSAGIRCVRSGLDLAAGFLLRRFLRARPPAEPRLYVEAERHLATLLARPAWTRWSRRPASTSSCSAGRRTRRRLVRLDTPDRSRRGSAPS
jgi:hypothetical protein